jgi:hypothetical protein
MRGGRQSAGTFFGQASDARQFGVKGSRLLEQTLVGRVQASAFFLQMLEATNIGMFDVHYVVA